jgi:hypothetical protein
MQESVKMSCIRLMNSFGGTAKPGTTSPISSKDQPQAPHQPPATTE